MDTFPSKAKRFSTAPIAIFSTKARSLSSCQEIQIQRLLDRNTHRRNALRDACPPFSASQCMCACSADQLSIDKHIKDMQEKNHTQTQTNTREKKLLGCSPQHTESKPHATDRRTDAALSSLPPAHHASLELASINSTILLMSRFRLLLCTQLVVLLSPSLSPSSSLSSSSSPSLSRLLSLSLSIERPQVPLLMAVCSETKSSLHHPLRLLSSPSLVTSRVLLSLGLLRLDKK